jgi:hypothetical protein
MAQVVLGGIGGALGGGVGRIVGGALGRAVDGAWVAGLGPARQRGPRLEGLRIQSTAEGAPVPCVLGRARIAGQVIWAARFQEGRSESSGGKGGPRSVDYDYSLSFALALGEGPIDGVGRVWADGHPLDLSGVTMRVHRGTADQTPDPLIEAVEGAAPAYRGVAYVVFEDLPLGSFGDRPPQLSFEVFRRPAGDGLEERLEGVCLIPGAGEFVLATERVLRREGLTRTAPETVHHGEGRPDILVSLDQLTAQCPNLKRVSLVVGWFGDDLRAGNCTVRPGVESRDKATEPMVWSVAGLDRETARLISRVDDRPAYGGTPDDESVRQAVAALKARGLEVTLYPFVFMDIAADNDLPDPYGGARQAAYPWRGRIKGEDGAGAGEQVAALFDEADGWGLRRMALHYAALAAETGADGLLIGSEMRGLTWTRDAAGGYPAVAALRALAAECRAVVGPDVALSYAADWSEYFGHQPGDGSGDRMFHLDPLWADPVIDHVAIDWYAPLSDWRDGDGGVDAAAFDGPMDAEYLAAGVAGGEGFDWFYADDADRATQARTSIVDTAHGEHWVFRPKDLKGWWANAHHDRPGGVRSGPPTAWVPQMKPIRLSEFGCAAVDRGGNAPNLFQDPKSAESALPPYSTGARSDLTQRRALEAVLGHFAQPANNPVSSVYGGPMLAAADAWCWDARPYPAFPALSDVWADAGAWAAGHWLNGRLTGEAGDLIAAVLRRGGLADDQFSIAGVQGEVSGYVIDRPMRTRDALEPLLAAVGAVAAERDGRVAILGRTTLDLTVSVESLALPDEGAGVRADRSLEPRPEAARVRFSDEAADYQTGAVVVRGDGDGGAVDLDLAVVCAAGQATAVAGRLLAEGGDQDGLTLALDPLTTLRLEPGDGVAVEGREGLWRVVRVVADETPSAVVERVREAKTGVVETGWRIGAAPVVTGAPLFRLLDLPGLPGREADARPLAVAAGDPWRRMQVHAGPDVEALRVRAIVERSATVGVLTESLAARPVGRWDAVNAITVRVEGRAPSSAGEAAVLGGANAVAVETPLGWEIVQYRTADLIGAGVWRLSGLLRGQQGSEVEMAAVLSVGALVVWLDEALVRADIGTVERGLPLVCRAGPIGAPAGGAGVSEIDFTYRALALRPWAPAHLKVEAAEAGWTLSWTPRDRAADSWDGEAEAPSGRFRVRVLDGAAEVRVFEAAGAAAVYAAAEIAEDFPEGIGPSVRVGAAQWGDGFGWGAEATAAPG